MAPVSYLRLAPGAVPPSGVTKEPKKVIVIIEAAVSQQWQWDISAWLVRSGCLFMMAWGLDCSSWDDSMDMANLEEFDFGEIPHERCIMTTWHSNETLSEVFRFSKDWARHATVELAHTLLLHVATQDKGREMLDEFAAA
jgi:hypothetical protein